MTRRDRSSYGPTTDLREPDSVEATATTALPHPHQERATAALWAELRHKLMDADPENLADWSTLVVSGLIESTDGRGRTWFEYVATIKVRPLHGTPCDDAPSN
jgi:hypothetical protein